MATRCGPSERGGACVVELGLLAHRTLRRGRRGRIAAVFDRSLYATLDDDWICIGHTAIGSGPLHVLCDGIAVAELSAGQEIAVNDTAVFVGDAELSDLDAAPVWSPPPPPDWTHETLHAGIRAVDSTWHVAASDEGLAAAGCVQLLSAPSRTVAAAMPAIAALKRAIGAALCGQEAALVDGTETIGLIGLGPGLTPSGDDLLGGALVALTSLGFPNARDALWTALRAHLDRTSDISAAHLRAAASGYAASALHEAVNATVSGRVDRIASALAVVSSIGHSSGRDAFAGALIVFRAVENLALCGDGGAQRSVLAS